MTTSVGAHSESCLKADIERHWQIGALSEIQRIERGLVNQTFRVATADGRRRILRLYHPDMPEARIRREHDLLQRLEQVGFGLSPRLVAPNSPPTWKRLRAPLDGHRYMALTTRLPGEDRYTWDRPPQRPAALRTLGETLTGYHRAVYGWRGTPDEAAAREERALARLAETLAGTPPAPDALDRLARALPPLDRSAWPALMVHGDYHAANVRWHGGAISGLFDFEYAALDWRLYDLATALACLAFPWAPAAEGPAPAGAIAVDLMRAFLDGYAAGLDPVDPLPPLLPDELSALPDYLILAQLLTLEWGFAPGTRNRLGDVTADRYAAHARGALMWLLENDVPV